MQKEENTTITAIPGYDTFHVVKKRIGKKKARENEPPHSKPTSPFQNSPSKYYL